MNILCTDKTGTLTENKISLVKHLNLEGKEDETVFRYGFLNSYFQSGLKNPLDAAILDHQQESLDHYIKIDEIPYSFERKRLSVVIQSPQNKALMITKGQPEEILKICTISEDQKSEFKDLYNELSKRGFRVLAVCHRQFETGEKFIELSMTCDGFLAFLDPAKMSAQIAIENLQKYGVNIKIITGDNELVTRKICSDLSLNITNLINGDDFDTLVEAEKLKVVESHNLFTRFNPAQKQEVITLLKQNGNVAGYMGDGINDAPSLKTADIGVSVDNAVDVARESADLILLNKDLNILIDGLREGRQTFGNTIKYMLMVLSSNFGNMFSMLGAVLFLPYLPMLPIQILLNNSLYDLSQLTIPLDTVDEEYIQKPFKWDIHFLQRAMLIFGPISSIFDFITFFVLFKIFRLDENGFQSAWFLESILTQVLVIYVLRSQKCLFKQTRPNIWLIINTIIIIVIALSLPFLSIGKYFSLQILSSHIYTSIFIIVGGYLGLTSLIKILFYKYLVKR